jgi:AAA ATPase domain/AAA domain, putative AbiEii toxin, Type IV TA system
MRIDYIRIENYKCFRDTGKITIAPHFTVLIGQNNVGKTAFLEALKAAPALNKPHREPDRNDQSFPRLANPKCHIELGITMSGEELKWRILSTNVGIHFAQGGRTRASVERAFTQESLAFTLAVESGGQWELKSEPFQKYGPDITQAVSGMSPSSDRQSVIIGGHRSSSTLLSALLGDWVVDSIYMFRAERLNAEISPISHSADLSPDAANLASVLLQLGTNPGAETRMVECIRTVFPSILSAVSHPIEGNRAQILVTNRISEQNKTLPGISVPLGDSGSGVGQVLAMLYVALTSHFSKIIVIDEPNSFLHPGATKRLLQILKTTGHQYIVTTHSPEIVRASDPDTLHLLEWTGMESTVKTVDHGKIEDLRSILSEVGVRLSDLFGADNVLWVEGITEQHCFPLLMARLGHPIGVGTAVVSLVNTGDLESHRARAALVWEVYERLSLGNALVPPALAFSLDREGRTEAEMEDMRRRSKGLLHFLPRRAYENYLIHPSAIAAVLNHHLPEVQLTADAIKSELAKRAEAPKYSAKASYDDPLWTITVNAPLLLGDIFSEVSATRIEYRKTTHSIELTEWLLTNEPQHLAELTTYVQSLFVRSG